MSPDEVMQQVTGLKRRVRVLEGENAKLREAAELTVRTLDLCRDKTANPLTKMCDRERAERMLREAIARPEAAK